MGQGLPHPAPGMLPWARMFDLPPWTGDETSRSVAVHWYLDGLQAPEPVEIPWSWLSGPMRFRQDRAATHAAVSKVGGGTAIAQVSADEQISFTASLQSGNDVDPANLAQFVVDYYDEARTRLAEVRLVLNERTDEELWTILGVEIGTRITITGTPTGWPEGADSLVVEGIHPESSTDYRAVTWATSPVIGEAAGEVGPFFRVDVSTLDGGDKLPW